MPSIPALRPALAALALVAAVWSPSATAADYVVGTPTAVPYTPVISQILQPGPFTDQYSFTISGSDPVSSFIWAFPQRPAGDLGLLYGTADLTLSLLNTDTNALVGTGIRLADLPGFNLSDPALLAEAQRLAQDGYDLINSVYWSGVLGNGHYLATVSGFAGGDLSAASGLGGGITSTKFHIPAVPEPTTVALLLSGLAVGSLALRRRRSA